MNSRMDRYNNNYEEDVASKSIPSRVSKNNPLYQDIRNSDLSRIRNNDNVTVIDNPGKTIDIEKIKRYIQDINDQPRSRRRSVFVPQKEEEAPVRNSAPKDYDLNSVLEKAKQSREINYDVERHKKLHDTQYDILNKINMYQSDEEEEETLTRDDFNTEEKTLIDLINTVTIHNGDVNLLEELMSDSDEDEKVLPVDLEVEKHGLQQEIEEMKKDSYSDTSVSNLLQSIKEDPSIASGPYKDNSKHESDQLRNEENSETNVEEGTFKADDSFYTSSMSFSKQDFEGFEELEKSVKKNSVLSIVLMFLLVVIIIGGLVVILNYVLKLGLF